MVAEYIRDKVYLAAVMKELKAWWERQTVPLRHGRWSLCGHNGSLGKAGAGVKKMQSLSNGLQCSQ